MLHTFAADESRKRFASAVATCLAPGGVWLAVSDVEHARAIVSDLATWPVMRPTASDVLAAIDSSVRWQIPLWDAMIVVSAQRAGAGVLWSEDLNAEQQFDAVTVRNPFAHDVNLT